MPNIWCLCKTNINLTIIHVHNKLVAFTIIHDSKAFGYTYIHASTCHRIIRDLWSKLSDILTCFKIPWCLVRDYNAIMEAHEYMGSHTPVRQHMVDFQEWTSINDLIHLPIICAYFSRYNGMKGRSLTEKRLDRVVCNQKWTNSCIVTSCTTLVKNISDHFPNLLDFQFRQLPLQASVQIHDNVDLARVLKRSYG